VDQDYAGSVAVLVVFDRTEPVDLADEARGRRGRTVTSLVNDRAPGPLGTRNTGLLAARSDVVAFLDDDDEWLPGKLAQQVEVLQSGTADVVFTGVRYVADGRYREYLPKLAQDPVAGLIGGGVFLPIQSMAAWRTAVGDDLLDEAFPTGGDQELALRLLLRRRVAVLPEALVLMNRAHTNRLTMDYERMLGNVTYMRRKHAELFARYRPDPSRNHARFALLALGTRRRRDARTWVRRALRANPRRPRNWLVAVAVLLLPPMSLHRLQSLHHRLFWRRLPAVERR
jgi:glycosyltransferase involved in cell wall biosynthesis